MKNKYFVIFTILTTLIIFSNISLSQELTAVLKAIEKYQEEMKKLINTESNARTSEIKSIKKDVNEITSKIDSISNGKGFSYNDYKNQIASLKESVNNLNNEVFTIKEKTKEGTEYEKTLQLAQNLQTLMNDLVKSIKESDKESSSKTVSKDTKNERIPKFEMFYKVMYYYDEYNPDNSTFQLKEVRPTIKGEINSYFSYKIHAEIAGTPKLLDATLEAKLSPNLSMIVGQFKTPFSTGLLVSSNAEPFVNRELMKPIEPDRDIGVQFSSKFPSAKMNLIAGVLNGATINEIDKNRYKNFVLRGIFSPVQILEIAGNYYIGKTNVKLNPDNIEKLGGSITLRYNNIFSSSEYIKSTTAKMSSDGFYTILGYNIKSKHPLFKEFEPIMRYEAFDNNIDIYGDSKTRLTLGLNIYFQNRFNKLQINYQINDEEKNKIFNNELFTNLQISF